MNLSLRNQIEQDIQETITEVDVGGRIKTDLGNTYFLKQGKASQTYQCEVNGLRELAKTHTIQVAQPVSYGKNYILTQFIEQHQPKDDFFEVLGKQLAQMHRHTQDSYGFYEDNFIGDNPQKNIPTPSEANNWAEFYYNKRLLYQYKLAQQNNLLSPTLIRGFKNLEKQIESILKDSIEPPTLIHGDLWAGNFLCTKNNSPILIDPAVYYGHREAELAMTKLFGGFSAAFYQSYQTEYPLREGWKYREGIYTLYHVLNHLNLFGRSYLSEAEYLISQYL